MTNPTSKDVAAEMREHYGPAINRATLTPNHYEGCWRDHWACAVARLLDECDRRRPTVETPADTPLTASDRFVELFKREPSVPSDLAWMNGYATARAEQIVARAVKAPAEPEWQWTRDDATTRDCLSLVSLDIPLSEIATWTDEQVQHAEQWSGTCHAVASDNDEVDIPPEPSCITEWKARQVKTEGPQP